MMNMKDEINAKDQRPPKGAWAPGDYMNRCCLCGEMFIGDKLACMCADCAYISVTQQDK